MENDKCWFKRCTGKVLRDFRGERNFFFSFLAEFKTWATKIGDKHYKPAGIPVIEDVEVCLGKAESIALGDFIGMRGRNGK